ncbi:autotransporter outer membrane beta-barrel domain-containing protein [Adhaeretor mobilis]|uniref:Uncharacterized protein n=1 Tax=Adhaeretor mobilis TaxID=1930276 RepID=A0A517MTG9_9BACT|nr:hypothetical protein [Adhaeretor mobilis]QDS98176.1 hypothetical protein HG15A2_14490 [Adhaeretor mobilis]
MKISKLILAFSAMLALTMGIAQAYTVTHSTQGVLFSDDMEGAFSAEIGTWGTTNDGANLLSLSSMNTGSTFGGPAEAALGNDYLQLTRPSSPSKERFQEAIFTESVSTGTLDIAFSYWINNPWGGIVTLDDAVGANPGLADNLATIMWAGSSAPGGGTDTVWYDWSNSSLTDAVISAAQWNLFEMHVDLDANTYQISVNGAAGALVSTPSGTVSRIGLEFQTFDTTLFLDAPLQTPPIEPTRIWTNSASGDWNANSNWNSGVAPNSSTGNAIFGSAISSPATVFTNSAVTVESIQFGTLDDSGATQSYAIAGQGSVSLASTPSINVIDGTHQFQTVVNLLGSTDVSVAAGASLAFNNALNLNANTLTKTGAGTLSINNQLSSVGGEISALAGVISGSGSITSNLNNDGATVAPGNSPGMLSVDGNYTQTAGSLSLEIGGTNDGSVAGVREFDQLNVIDDLTISGGSLVVSMINGFVPKPGDKFDILNFTTADLSGATLNLGTPGADLLWDSSQLAVDGSLTVIAAAVPEPLSASLMVIAWSAFALVSRQRNERL